MRSRADVTPETRRVVHLAKRGTLWGGATLSSRCGRLRTTADGMNLTDDPQAVTCKFCLRYIRRAAPP